MPAKSVEQWIEYWARDKAEAYCEPREVQLEVGRKVDVLLLLLLSGAGGGVGCLATDQVYVCTGRIRARETAVGSQSAPAPFGTSTTC